jgi:hypothetical protein
VSVAFGKNQPLTTNPVIQKFISCLLLVLFTVSILPQRFFHDAIASHKDAPVCQTPSPKTDCLHQQGFHCFFNDVVVTTPYVWTAVSFGFHQPHFTSSPEQREHSFFVTQHLFETENRGPPAV